MCPPSSSVTPVRAVTDGAWVCVCPCEGLKEGCWVACVRVKGQSAAHPPSSPLPLVLPPLTFGEASEGVRLPRRNRRRGLSQGHGSINNGGPLITD
ncbi:hypothetical protein QQF64_013120 [Cirrhinus molitorella]|uniref:Uncharacterized protein n=1 Tax=Cirrhinus molitorella TaxID=172907 RepID=A0ABR3LTQ6_9TELE